jgi:hypothetical protein
MLEVRASPKPSLFGDAFPKLTVATVVVQGKCQCKLFSDNVSGCEISVLLRFDVVLPVGAAE